MLSYYLDTSALVKRYALETGTDWITALIDSAKAYDLYTVRLTGPEMIAALFRKARVRELPYVVAIHLARDFRNDWKWRYNIVEINAAISDQAMILAEKHNLRGYDVVHLAAALLLQQSRRTTHLPDLVFLAADNDLLRAAEVEGLRTDNPNHYS